jgi:hypothetical protein
MQLCAATGSDHFHYSGVLVASRLRNLLDSNSAKIPKVHFEYKPKVNTTGLLRIQR